MRFPTRRPHMATPIRALLFSSAIHLASFAAEPDASLVRDSDPLPAEVEQQKLKVPEGFEVHLVASEPMISKPMNLAFDAKGRLWVSSTREYPYPAAKDRWADPEGTRVRDSIDAIKILEDTNGDGRADKAIDFVDGLNVPIGVLPYKNGCIAWSIPNIWFFEDTDGDDRCDKRTILFGPIGYERDTHGNIASLRLAPDGWVYATHGYNNTTHLVVRPENRKTPVDPTAPPKPTPSAQNTSLPRDQLDWGNSLDLHSGNVFRFKPDGSAVESWSWGQVNPFGLTRDSWGNLYSADCHSNPITQVIRGAFYPSFGKPHDGMGFGPVLCEHAHGSTGICGPLYIDGGVWGTEWDDHMFVCNPVTSRVNHDFITFAGSTPKANERDDFIVSEDLWFRPVDIRLGPDGALYIADFYNKIIGHYEVPLTHPGRDRERGRIWRIINRKVDRQEVTDAMDLSRQWRLKARDPHSGWEEAGSDLAALEILQSPKHDGRLRRVVAEVIAEHPTLRGIAGLCGVLKSTPEVDRSMRHTLALALREHLKLPGAYAEIEKLRPGDIPATQLAVLARTVATPESSTWLLGYLERSSDARTEVLNSLNSLARNLPADRVPQLVALAKRRFAEDVATQADLAQAIANGLAERGAPLDGPTVNWAQEVADRLLSSLGADPTPEWEALPNTLQKGLAASKKPWVQQPRPTADGKKVQMISSLEIGGDAPERRTGILRSKPFLAPARLTFWICGHRGAPDKEPHEKNFVRLIDAATGDEWVRVFPPRSDTAQRLECDLAPHVGKSARLEMVDGDTGDAWAWLALGGLDPAVVRIENFQSQDQTQSRLQRLATMLRHSAPLELRQKLAVFLPAPPPPPPSPVTAEQRVELDRLIKARLATFAAAKPDAHRGEQLFAVHCAICHAVGGRGALVGPQLDGVGNRGAERLLEDILDPNRNVDVNFYVHIISKKDGTVFAGLERGEVGQVLLGVDATGKEHRLAKAEIDKNETTGLSLMPAAFAQSIPESDFHDLIAWLMIQQTAK
jgi:putative membrane-bound dehydrogenase-like protein